MFTRMPCRGTPDHVRRTIIRPGHERHLNANASGPKVALLMAVEEAVGSE
jgi:hypothetical protein